VPPFVQPGYVEPGYETGTPSEWRDAWNAIGPVLGEVVGGRTITIKRPSTLRGRSSLAAAGAPASALTLGADAASGDQAVTLRIATGTFGGTLLAGSRLTIADARYTATADANPAGNLITVQITPALAADAASGVPVTLDAEINYTFFGCIMSGVTREDVTGDLSGELAAKIAFPVIGAPTVPRMNDIVILEDGRALRVVSDPPTTGGWYDCLVGFNRAGGANP